MDCALLRTVEKESLMSNNRFSLVIALVLMVGVLFVAAPGANAQVLIANKTNDANGGAGTLTLGTGNTWHWTIQVTNASGATATFTNGQVILSDTMPSTNITYSPAAPTVTPSGTTGTISCALATNVLTCTASGTVTIPVGANFSVTVTASPTAIGTYDNGGGASTCTVDPAGGHGGPSTCENSVTVGQPDLEATKTDDTGHVGTLGVPWHWKIIVSNKGTAPANFNIGDTVLTDTLPSPNVTYGAIPTSSDSNISCAIVTNLLTCTATAADTIQVLSSVTITITATPTQSSPQAGFVNPTCAAGGTLPQKPNLNLPDPNTHACNSDTVFVLPNLAAVKTHSPAGSEIIGQPFSWSIQMTNTNSPAVFTSGQVILRDDLPTNGTYDPLSVAVANTVGPTSGGFTCAITGPPAGPNTLVCTAGGSGATLGITFNSTVSFNATPSTTNVCTIGPPGVNTCGSLVNPNPAGVCSIDPDKHIVQISGANNNCADTVPIVAPILGGVKTNTPAKALQPFNWMIVISNSSSSVPAIFPTGGAILTDCLQSGGPAVSGCPPASQPQITYPAQPVITPVNLATGTITNFGNISCGILTSPFISMNCTASGPVILGPGASFRVTFTGTAPAPGTYQNGGTVNPVGMGGLCPVPGTCASAIPLDIVVILPPNIETSKTDNTSGSGTVGTPFNWTIKVSNSVLGNPNPLLGDAAYASGETILSDQLPTTNITYTVGPVAIANVTNITNPGNISCAVSATFLLTCTTTGPVTLQGSGTLTSSFTVTVAATPTASGSFTNPTLPGVCTVNPPANAAEPAVPCGPDTVSVVGPHLTGVKSDSVGGSTSTGAWNWILTVTNGPASASLGPATYASGATILTDSLPSTNIAYGAPIVATTNVTGTIACTVSLADVLTCTASGGPVTLQGSSVIASSFTVTIPATASAPGSFTNTCTVIPPAAGAPGIPCNTDVVNFTLPNLTAIKTDSVNHNATSGTWTWTITVANGPASAALGNAVYPSGSTILTDTLPSGLTYGAAIVGGALNVLNSGSISCGIAANLLTCTANGATVTLQGSSTLSSSFNVSFTATAAAGGTFTNPPPAGTCAVVPPPNVNVTGGTCSDTVTVPLRVPDVTATKTDSVGGSLTFPGNFTWTITIANQGGANAVFPLGSTILTDNLPNVGITYAPQGTVVPANLAGGITGTINCTLATADLTCTAGTIVTLPPGSSFTVSVVATPLTPVAFTNPRLGGVCVVDPNGVIPNDPNLGNNMCSDTVIPFSDAYQVNYISNLNIGDGCVNVTNAGSRGGFDANDIFGRPAGGICVNTYTFDPNEEMLSCCSCYVSPNGNSSLCANNDLLFHTLTGARSNAIVVKLLATVPNGTACNPAAPIQENPAGPSKAGDLTTGLRAWATTLHQNTSTAGITYQTTDKKFENTALSPSELQKLILLCGSILTNGSGNGVCHSCLPGAQ
jgi:hypothetical protein